MKSRWVIGATLAVALLAGSLAWRAGAAIQKGEDKKATRQDDKTEKPRAAGRAGKGEEAAIRKQDEAFSAAFNKGDLEGLMALWTQDAEFIREDGKVVRGRAAIRDMLAGSLKRSKGHQHSIEMRTLRFIKPDVALEEASVSLKAPDGTVETGPYATVWVKQGGKWLLSSVRDLPDQPAAADEGKAATYPHLKQLSWMVGEWTDKKGEVTVSCKWAPNQSFIVQEFTVRRPGAREVSVLQRIGWDAVRQQLRSWVFDSRGGYSVGSWQREGNTWIVASEGSLPDGRTGTANNRYRFINNDTFTWSSHDREVDEQPMPDVDVTYIRKKPDNR